MASRHDKRSSPSAKSDEKSPHKESPEDELTGSFFGRVLAAASDSIAQPSPADSRVAAALADVARRFQGQTLELDPVGVALIEALLAAEFPDFSQRPQLLSRAAKAVAQSLLADPAARVRLENLWATLGERIA